MSIVKDIYKNMLYRCAKSKIVSVEAREKIRLKNKESGAVAAEYALVSAIIAAFVIVAASAMDGPLNTFITQTVTKLTALFGI